MLSNKMKRCLSFLMAMIMIASLAPVPVLATAGDIHDHTTEVAEEVATKMEETVVMEEPVVTEETVATETPVVTNPEIERLQGLINEIYGKYLANVKTADEVQAAVDVLTDIQCEDAWMDIMLLEDEFNFAQADNLATEAELLGLVDINPIMSAFADVVIPRAEATMPPRAVLTDRTFGTYLKITDSANNSTLDGTTYTAKASGGWWDKATNTITLSNTNTVDMKLTLSYKVASANEFKIDNASAETEGTISKILKHSDTVVFYIKSNSGISGTTVTLTLSNLEFVEVASESDVTFAFDENLGGVTVDGTAVSDGDVKTIAATGATLVATPASGISFLGWVDGNDKILSTDASYTLEPAADMTIRPAFASADTAAWFKVGSGMLFNDLNAAVGYAQSSSDKVVVLSHDGTLLSANYTIPSGVKLLIPFSASDTGDFKEKPDNGVGETTGISNYDKNGITGRNYAFRTLKVASGAKITCSGEICVNGQRQNDSQPYTGVSLGGHGRIHLLGSGEQLIMASGSKLWCYGYIIGSGMVNVQKGAQITELMQMTCWPGGGNFSDWDKVDDKSTLFLISQYYIQNVEAPLKLNAGATAYVDAVLNISVIGEVKANLPYAGTSGLFKLQDGASVIRTYDASTDRVTYEQYGTINLGSMSISEFGVSLNSENNVMPLGSNMTLKLMDGSKMTMDKRLAILPGAEIIVSEGATMDVTGEIYVVDKSDYTKSHFFNRTTMTLKSGHSFTTTGKSPNFAPLPYVATNNGLSARVSKLVRGSTTTDNKTTQRIYTNIKALAPSGKLTVNGIVNVTGNGLIATTSKNSTADKNIDGTGVINYTVAPNAGTLKFGVSSVSAVTTSNALANLAGVGTLQKLGQATYYGQGDGYWYQHAVTVSGDATVTVVDTNGVASSALSSYDERTVNGTVVAVAANGGSVSFELADSKMPTITGTYGSMTAAPGSADGTVCYTVTNVTGDVNIAVSDSGTATTLIVAATNAGGATMSTKQIMLPAGVAPSGYFSDKECTKAATADDIGKTIYEAATAVAAIGPDKGNYTYAYTTVADAVAAATGDNDYVMVLKDRTLSKGIVVGSVDADGNVTVAQNITLDLGGKKLDGGTKSFEPLTNNKGSTLRLINGTITYKKSSGATVRNKGTIEYIEGVTLQEMYNATTTSVYALYNEAGATINEIRSGRFECYSQRAGYVINNYGAIGTIGTSGNTVDIYGRRAIEMAGSATITTVGGAGSTVNITGGQRGIDLTKKANKITTIGATGSTVNFYSGEYQMHKSGIYCAGAIDTIGEEGSTLTFSLTPNDSHGMSSYGINVSTNGTIKTIGEAGSKIIITGSSAQTGHSKDTGTDDPNDYYDNHMYGIYNAGTITNLGSEASGEYGGSDLRITVSHSGENGHSAGIYNTGTIKNIGGNGAVIYINSNYTGTFKSEYPSSSKVTATYGYGIYNSGKLTNGFHPGARIELVCNQMPLRTGENAVTVDGVTLIYTGDGGHYPLHNTSTSVAMVVNGGNFHALSREQISKNPNKITYKDGYELSTTTRNVTLVDGTTYPCYYLAKNGAGIITGEEPGGTPAIPEEQGILGDIIAEYLAMNDNSDTYIVLTQNCDEPTSITLTGDVYLDLNGYSANLTGLDLNGNKLYVIDSATNAYLTNDGDKAGYIIGFDGASTVHTSDRGASKGKHYVQVSDGDRVEFHRVANSVSAYRFFLVQGDAYLSVEGTFRGTEAGLNALNAMGFVLVGEENANEFNSGTLLNNYPEEGKTSVLVKNDALVKIKDGDANATQDNVTVLTKTEENGKKSYYLPVNYSFAVADTDLTRNYDIFSRMFFTGGSADSAAHSVSLKEILQAFIDNYDGEDKADKLDILKNHFPSLFETGETQEA